MGPSRGGSPLGRRERVSLGADSNPLSMALGELLRGDSAAPEGSLPEPRPERPPEAPPTAPTREPPAPDRYGRVLLRRETKGRGGKTVTVVEFRESRIADPEATARELRRGLGCGARVEGERLILQGDQVERAAEWFVARGGRAVRGN